jgi:hypothetical protein
VSEAQFQVVGFLKLSAVEDTCLPRTFVSVRMNDIHFAVIHFAVSTIGGSGSTMRML